jgi:integrase
MTHIKLRYVHQFIDRHGHTRFYFRRGGKRVPLPGSPFSAEFEAAYRALLDGSPEKPVNIGVSRMIAGTVGAAVVGYLASGDFRVLAASSQKKYRIVLNGLVRDHADKRLAFLERRHVVQMLNARAATPAAARDLLRGLRLIVQYAISIGVMDTDPTAGVRFKMPKSGGYRTWSEEAIATFEAAYSIGTKPRLALALMLGTALRVSDVVRIGRGHVRNGALHIVQQKTKAAVALPITAALAEIINASAPPEHLTFLISEGGRSFSTGYFSKWFRDQCKAIGLTGLSAHGLRKAACRRMAEAGCSANEIAAISGHVTLTEVARYTKAADQARMARRAIERTERQHELATLPAESGKPSKKHR